MLASGRMRREYAVKNKTEEAILLALEALLSKQRQSKEIKAAREKVLDALEGGGYRWPRSDDGRF
jgi:hypothetical protein